MITLYDKNKNQDDLETNIKMLVFNFGIKVLTNIKLTDEFMTEVLEDTFNLRDFIVYCNTFIRFLPYEKLDTELFAKFIIKMKKEDLYDIKIFRKDFENEQYLIDILDFLLDF